MATRRKTLLTAVGAAGFAATTLMGLASPAQAQAGKTFVMKLSTATINDTQHEWLQAVRGGGREGFGRPHQGRDLSGQPARPDSAPDRRRAVRLDPGLDRPAGIPGRRRRALRGAERAGPVHQHDQAVKVIAIRSCAKLMLGLGANKGLIGVGIAPIGPSSIVMRKPMRQPRRLQGHEDPRAGVAVPARADPAHGRLAGRDDARRRAARPPAGRHRRRARHHHRLHHVSVPGRRRSTSSRTTSPTSIRSS